MRKPIYPIQTLDDMLIRDEDWVNKAYPDPLSPAGRARASGKIDLGLDGTPWTIGVGHTGREVHQGLIWPDELVQRQLNIDILHTRMLAGQYFPWSDTFDVPRRAAFYNMLFNMGVKRLSGFKLMLAALQNHDWNTAAVEGMDSKWAQQVGDRAKRVTEQFRTGEWQ